MVTHDPMCFWWESQPEDVAAQDCLACRLIAMVRADTLKKAAQRVEATHQDSRIRSISRVLTAIREE